MSVIAQSSSIALRKVKPLSAESSLPEPTHGHVTQDHISDDTPMGVNLAANGATLRLWAPRARRVYIIGEFNGWLPSPAFALKCVFRKHLNTRSGAI